MTRLIVLRLLQGIPMIIAVIVVCFLMLQLIPGDPVQAMVGDFPVTPAFREAIETRYRLNDPFLTRLGSYLLNIARGDFGFSYQNQLPVLQLIQERLPRTALLVVAGFVVAIPLGLLVGLTAGLSPNRSVDRIWTTATLVAFAVPTFWLGQIFIIGFSLKLGWFPTQGMGPFVSRATGIDWFFEKLLYLALPVTVFAIHEGARAARIMRASVQDTLAQGYIVSARMKGLSRQAIIYGHVLRNSILPVVTTSGYAFGSMLGGTVLLESVFTWPGLGLLLIEAVRARDNMTVVGVVVIAAVMVILVNIIVDVLYAVIDPRVRSSK
jgi:peptide/nickel transport system permease protein